MFSPTPAPLALCLALLASGCVGVVIPGVTPPEAEAEAPPARVLPAAVRAALLPGVPESIVVEDGRGCYLVSNVVTEPRQGYLVTDAGGQPLCYDDTGTRIPRRVAEGEATPVPAADADAVNGIAPVLPPA